MSQTPIFTKLNDPIEPFPSEEEKVLLSIEKERMEALRAAELAEDIMNNINNIRFRTARNLHHILGISDEDEMSLKRNNIASTAEEVLLKERVNNKLQRRITSELAQKYLASGPLDKLGYKIENIMYGTSSLLGGSKMVENEMARRFGGGYGSQDILDKNNDQRIRFVVSRFQNDFLNNFFAINPSHPLLTNMQSVLGLIPGGAYDDALFYLAVCNATPGQLNLILHYFDHTVTPSEGIKGRSALTDLIFLKESLIEEKHKMLSFLIYDESRLHSVFDFWLKSPPTNPEHFVANFVLKTLLIPDSIWPHTKNPEARGLIAFLEQEIHERGAAALLKDLEQIHQNEIPLINSQGSSSQESPQAPEKIKLTPFQLLERLKRREYARINNLSPDYYHEEAVRYSTKGAENIVDQASDSLELYRIGNKAIAQRQKRNSALKFARSMLGGKASKEDLKIAFANAQRSMGLEPVELELFTASDLFNQIVDSDIRFYPFKGITKTTSLAELRKIIADQNNLITTNTLTDFIARIETTLKSRKVAEFDWDIEDALIILKKLKNEKWTREFIENVKASDGNMPREHIFVNLLSSLREQRASEDLAIEKIASNPNAIHNRLLSKNRLKQILNDKSFKALTITRKNNAEAFLSEAAQLDNTTKHLQSNDSQRIVALNRIAELKQKAEIAKRLLSDEATFKERVDNVRNEADRLGLGYPGRKRFFNERGLAQVYKKMGTNWRIERYLKNTKKTVETVYSGLKFAGKVLVSTTGKIINKENASKAYSISKYIASPVTVPLKYAYKIAAFPFKVVSAAMIDSKNELMVQGKSISKHSLRNFFIYEPQRIARQIDVISKRKVKLLSLANKANFRFEKIRYENRANELQKQIDVLIDRYQRLKIHAIYRKMEQYLAPLQSDSNHANRAVQSNNAIKKAA